MTVTRRAGVGGQRIRKVCGRHLWKPPYTYCLLILHPEILSKNNPLYVCTHPLHCKVVDKAARGWPSLISAAATPLCCRSDIRSFGRQCASTKINSRPKCPHSYFRSAPPSLSQGPDSIAKKVGLKNHLSFGLRFPTKFLPKGLALEMERFCPV